MKLKFGPILASVLLPEKRQRRKVDVLPHRRGLMKTQPNISPERIRQLREQSLAQREQDEADRPQVVLRTVPWTQGSGTSQFTIGR